MKDLTKIYIDLSKCTEEQQKHIISLLPEPSKLSNLYTYDQYEYLHFDTVIDEWFVSCASWGKNELTYPDFIKLFEGGEDNNGWIKIESEADLPKETCTLHVYPNYLERDIFFFHDDELSRDELMENHTHYQPIKKPEPPKF